MKTHETTIYYFDIELQIAYRYEPVEEDTYYFHGCDAEVTILSVSANGLDIITMLTEDQIQDLEQEVLEYIN